MGIQIETVKTASFSMDYFRFGHGKETLVIIPGLSVQSVMGFADSVAEAYKIFADEYTVYLFDRRNELPETYTVYEMAKDTAEAIQTLGLHHIHLFGTSQGGMISMVIAAEYPDLVKKLVLGSSAASLEDERMKKIESWVQLAKEGKKEELYLAFGKAIYPEEIFAQSKALLSEAAKTVTDEDLKRFIIMAEGMKGFNITGDLKKIICPVFVIGSEDDRVLGADASAKIINNLNPENRPVLYMYEGYGHAAYDTAPDYKERIFSFLASE